MTPTEKIIVWVLITGMIAAIIAIYYTIAVKRVDKEQAEGEYEASVKEIEDCIQSPEIRFPVMRIGVESSIRGLWYDFRKVIKQQNIQGDMDILFKLLDEKKKSLEEHYEPNKPML